MMLNYGVSDSLQGLPGLEGGDYCMCDLCTYSNDSICGTEVGTSRTSRVPKIL